MQKLSIAGDSVVRPLRLKRTLLVRKLAGALLIISGITHVVQLAVYPAEGRVIAAASFGITYFLIGVFLIGRSRFALWWGSILPTIGGLLGVYRFLFLHSNPFSVFHVVIDVVVVPVCIYLLIQSR